jgi:hypothetical protein
MQKTKINSIIGAENLPESLNKIVNLYNDIEIEIYLIKFLTWLKTGFSNE